MQLITRDKKYILYRYTQQDDKKGKLNNKFQQFLSGLEFSSYLDYIRQTHKYIRTHHTQTRPQTTHIPHIKYIIILQSVNGINII